MKKTETVVMRAIAHIHTGFPTKFGIPRQSGLVKALTGKIIFEPEYRNPDAFRGLDGYSHLWLLWDFHMAHRSVWEPTVRPPRLGGNQRMGVFATRSPFRPNPIGLSCVEFAGLETDPSDGPVLWVRGADLVDNTPILDIKPYLPMTDSHPDAATGFAGKTAAHSLSVLIPDTCEQKIPDSQRQAIREILEQDPRPGYQRDPDRVYGFAYAGMEIRFRVTGEDVLEVTEILASDPSGMKE